MKINKHTSRKNDISHRLRWEDDGGKTSEVKTLVSGRHFVLPMQINIGTFPTPIEWDEKFVIEKYRPGVETGLILKILPGKK